MARGPGGRPGRGDYTLIRDGTDAVPAVEEGSRRKPGVWRLLGLAKEETCVIILATVFLLVSSLSTVAVPKLAGTLIDICINYKQLARPHEAAVKAQLNRETEIIVGVLVIGGFASGMRSWLFNSASERVMWRLRRGLFQRLIRQEMGFFDCVRTGELMNRLSEDTRLLKDAGTVTISIALRSTVVSIFGIALMFKTSVRLSVLSLLCLPVLLGAFRAFSVLNRRYTREGLTASASAATIAEESFGSIRTVRAFAKEEAACSRYYEAQQRVLGWGLKSAVAGGFFFGFTSTTATCAIVGVLWYGARQVVEGRISAGDLSSFVLYSMFVGANVGSLAGVISSYIQAMGASERVFELMDRIPKLPPSGTEKPRGVPEGGAVTFQGVWFSYPSRRDVPVLKGVELEVAPGQKLALVGPSGGGKSTIVNLIQRFYDPQRGQILLDGRPLTCIEHTWIHQQVSIVSQEPVLFADTILYNIAFGLPNAEAVTLAQVEEAAEMANCAAFIKSFPQGYHTLVGERGVRLSGGQKQRIAIARAIITRPRVLLLDEATSALDAESEALVQEALDRVAAGRTVVVIAHRLSTVQSAAEVAVIDGGVVAERGTHQELLDLGGVYATLVRRQLQHGSGGPSKSGSRASLAAIAEAEAAAAPQQVTVEVDREAEAGARGGYANGVGHNPGSSGPESIEERMQRKDTSLIVDDMLDRAVRDGLGRAQSARRISEDKPSLI